MDEAANHVHRPPLDPSKALALHANHERDAQVMSDLPAPDSAKDLTYRLKRHAIRATLLVVQLLILPGKLFIRRSIPFLYQFCQRSYVIRIILKSWHVLYTRLHRWRLLTTIITAWSQITTIPRTLDRLTVLLEENIELMNMERNDENKASVASVEVCRPSEKSVISPVTASAIYHAALANNRTLDDLLDTFDGGGACTPSCILVEERKDTPILEATSAWVERTSTSQSASSLTVQCFRARNLSSSTLNTPQLHNERQSTHKSLSALQKIQPSSLRHRSPVPSISTTTTHSSPRSVSSAASGNLARLPVTSAELQNNPVVEPPRRCTACDKSHSDNEQVSSSKEKIATILPVSSHRTVPKTRQSAIPRRSGRYLTNHRSRSGR